MFPNVEIPKYINQLITNIYKCIDNTGIVGVLILHLQQWTDHIGRNQCNPNQNHTNILHGPGTSNLKLYMEPQKTLNIQSNVEKENQSWINHNPNFYLYYKAVTIKTVCYWHKNRHIDQWKRTQNPGMDPQTYGQLIFDTSGNSIQWKKDSLFSKQCWEKWTTFLHHTQK